MRGEVESLATYGETIKSEDFKKIKWIAKVQGIKEMGNVKALKEFKSEIENFNNFTSKMNIKWDYGASYSLYGFFV